MINPETLLSDLTELLERLESDLRERGDDVQLLGEALRSAYEKAKQAERTAQPFETWREEYLTQVAAAWVLACVFLRFIEDNGLIDTPLLAGAGPRLDQAKDQRTLYFQQNPTDSDREYLYHVFRKVETLAAAAPLFDERHNPLWAFGVSGDGATLLIEFWQRIDPATGALAHDFADPALNTRFLGDLYQDLSEAARKKYALLQTPEFVEEFILDRTLTPAIAEFGLAEVRLIDPACGSGHFLLGAFHRLLHEWQKREPAVNVRELAQRALDAVSGVDLNPYAVAIARFRLLIAALKASGIHRLADAPAFRMNLATGDSLLHGPRPGGERQMYLAADTDPLRHVYDTEDADELRSVLGTQYQVVVGNPPYITVKDRALSEAYRKRFGSCYMKYSLAVPFMERFFDLAVAPSDGGISPAGYIGMITANSFMKREFGKKLIEEYLPKWDLTHVIDTSGAYIPGHGTPTVILLGRQRRPLGSAIRAVLGIHGEPQTPVDPSHGLVWSAILAQVDTPGSQSAFVSVADLPRESFHSHPWSIGGGGAAELKELLDESAVNALGDLADSIGPASFAGIDDAFVLSGDALLRQGVPSSLVKPFVDGESIRDWSVYLGVSAFVPYRSDLALEPLDPKQPWAHRLWPLRTLLESVTSFGGKTRKQLGEAWWSWYRWIPERYRTRQSIVFAFIATHNHFVLDDGGKVFNRSAPVIKLLPAATNDDHLALLGLLNSSTACFWMKQVFYPKGTATGDISTERGKPEANRYEFSGTGLEAFPIPAMSGAVRATLIQMVQELTAKAGEQAECEPEQVLKRWQASDGDSQSLRRRLADAQAQIELARRRMVFVQEELDWLVYSVYGLCSDVFHPTAPPEGFAVEPGHRPFMWTSDVGPSDVPGKCAEAYALRRKTISNSSNIGLIEVSSFKRPWHGRQGVYGRLSRTYEEKASAALREFLSGRLELAIADGGDIQSASSLGDWLRANDPIFVQVGECYRGRSDFDVTSLVAEVLAPDAVPFLAVLRYKPVGLGKRTLWERTWELQRREDAGEHVSEIPVPPKYTSADFLESTCWRLRGKLDVPSERFISYPHAEREADVTPVIGWAGWDHLQRAKALAGYYVRMKEREAWQAERLKPFLAGLLELLPWLKQWHNDLDPIYGIGMGDYFAGFVDEEARALGFTLDDLRAWQPPAGNSRRRRRASV